MSKLTKKEAFNQIISILHEQGEEALENIMIHEVELLAKKTGGKGNKKNAEINEQIRAKILDVLTAADAPMGATEIMEAVDISDIEGLDKLSLSKVNANLSIMGKTEKTIDKTKDKRRSVFSIGSGIGFIVKEAGEEMEEVEEA